MSIYVIRHGQTDWNIENRLQGQSESLLNDTGIAQANMAKIKLANIDFDLIISSSSKRAISTTNIINSDKNTSVKLDKRLLERSYGNLEGLYGNQINISELWSLNSPTKNPTVETIDSLFSRVTSLLDELKNSYKNEQILLSTHSGTSIAISCYFNDIPKDGNLLNLGLKNCAFIKYDF